MSTQLFAAVSSALVFGAEFSEWLLTRGVRIALILFFSLVVYKILKRFLDKSFRWRGEKKTSRQATLHDILAVALRVFSVAVAVLLVLPEFGVSSGPLIASLGIFGLAFSFGAQSLVKDLVAGFFILAEDLCRVGEEVKVGSVRGRVEGLKLRTLVLRDEQGALTFFPYGEAKDLTNYSRPASSSVSRG